MSQNITVNNQRIAKNAAMLYIRMFVTMLISLYTSRAVLQALGVDDYGIYNVVGGVISIMGVLNAAMSWSTIRFLTFDLGKGDKKTMQNTFSMCILIFVVLSAIFVLISESVGVWFLNTQMTISDSRIAAANWVFQFSILGSVLGLIFTPYGSLIFAHEDFSFSAYISIAESVLKLIIVLLLPFVPFDSLIMYSFLLVVVTLLMKAITYIWCKTKYEESRLVKYWNKTLFKEILSYSGWSLFGSLSNMAKNTGLNVILNLFFNPAVNAACGIANQVNGIIYQFFSSFFTAVNPQITKYYAQKDMKNMYELVFRSSKFSFYLILLLSVPIALEAPTIISLWLGQLPEHVVSFVRLIVVITAIDATAFPINATSTATGKIKLYQTVAGVISILNLPLSYIALVFGGSPEVVFVISLCLALLSFFARLWAINKVIDFPVKDYLKKVCLIVLAVASCVIPVPLIFHAIWSFDLLSSTLNCIVSIITTIVVVYTIGMTKSERYNIRNLIMKKLQKQ